MSENGHPSKSDDEGQRRFKLSVLRGLIEVLHEALVAEEKRQPPKAAPLSDAEIEARVNRGLQRLKKRRMVG